MMTDDWLLPWLTKELDNISVDFIDGESDNRRILTGDQPIQQNITEPYRDHGIN